MPLLTHAGHSVAGTVLCLCKASPLGSQLWHLCSVPSFGISALFLANRYRCLAIHCLGYSVDCLGNALLPNADTAPHGSIRVRALPLLICSLPLLCLSSPFSSSPTLYYALLSHCASELCNAFALRSASGQSFAPRRFADLRSCPSMLSSAFAFQRIATARRINAVAFLIGSKQSLYHTGHCHCGTRQIKAVANQFSSIAVRVRSKPSQIKSVPRLFRSKHRQSQSDHCFCNSLPQLCGP